MSLCVNTCVISVLTRFASPARSNISWGNYPPRRNVKITDDSFAWLGLHMHREQQQRKDPSMAWSPRLGEKVGGNIPSPHWSSLLVGFSTAHPHINQTQNRYPAWRKSNTCTSTLLTVYWPALPNWTTLSEWITGLNFPKEKCIAELKDPIFGRHIVRHESWHIALFPNDRSRSKVKAWWNILIFPKALYSNYRHHKSMHYICVCVCVRVCVRARACMHAIVLYVWTCMTVYHARSCENWHFLNNF